MSKLTDYLGTIQRTLRSKTVLSALAGFGIHAAVRRGWLPDTFFSNALEGLTYILCAVFRVIAKNDVRTGEDFSR